MIDKEFKLVVIFDQGYPMATEIEYQVYIQNRLGVIVWPKDITKFEEL